MWFMYLLPRAKLQDVEMELLELKKETDTESCLETSTALSPHFKEWTKDLDSASSTIQYARDTVEHSRKAV
jgi:hypothetical protein